MNGARVRAKKLGRRENVSIVGKSLNELGGSTENFSCQTFDPFI